MLAVIEVDLPVRQIAYFVADVRVAALNHHRRFGSGPYFVAEHIPLRRSLYRGVEQPLDHSSAYGQWGTVMLEFVQQNNPGPSAFHDLYPAGGGRFGLHHVAIFVDDIHAAMERFNGAGGATALYAEMNDGFAFAMIDLVADMGHMLELYEPKPQLTGFYAFVAQAADGFDGGDPLRSIKL
jgi:catechol 2,3-dioxygenase-like lactoylglutathione lyase family enzyme